MGINLSQDQWRDCQDGECIFREGDSSQEMYIIFEGAVEVVKEKPFLVLARLKRGEFLGEMSLLESLPRSASAFAKGNTRLLCIQPGGFLLKIRRDPTFAFELLQSLSSRVRATNEKLLAILAEGRFEANELKQVIEENAA